MANSIKLRLISEVKKLHNKVVLVRISADVPLQGNKILDDSRLCEALPTIRFLERHGAKIILVGHLGRPEGRVVPKLSLKPVGYAFGKLLRQPVKVLPLSVGRTGLRAAAKQGIVLLENIRFERGEEENTSTLSRKLASIADLYVNESLATSHRQAASIVGVTRFLPSYAGLALAHEVHSLEHIRQGGKKPMVAIIGGAKISDKLPVIKKLLPKFSNILVGGAVANTLLMAKKNKVGQSLVELDMLPQAIKLLTQAKSKILLPVDVVVLSGSGKKAVVRKMREVAQNDKIFDLGPKTIALYSKVLKKAKTIFWGGPIGLVEDKRFSAGTLELAKVVSTQSHNSVFVLVGGGDTASFFHKQGMRVNHISLAGGAMLEFLAGEELPGLRVLETRK